MRHSQKLLIFLFAALLLSAFLHFGWDKFPDPDVFYHFRHADLYADKGITFADFPWTQYSVINKFSADIWYGFHSLLIPFTFFGNEIFGMRLAGLFVTLTALLMLYFSFKRAGTKWAGFWPFLL